MKPLRTMTKLAVKLAEAINYLHTRAESISHTNLKPKNILLDRDFNAFISDPRITLFDD